MEHHLLSPPVPHLPHIHHFHHNLLIDISLLQQITEMDLVMEVWDHHHLLIHDYGLKTREHD